MVVTADIIAVRPTPIRSEDTADMVIVIVIATMVTGNHGAAMVAATTRVVTATTIATIAARNVVNAGMSARSAISATGVMAIKMKAALPGQTAPAVPTKERNAP
ncbi:hypothetical protein SKA58_04060 [Sphingomonas sp. SKA58]|nr:hypothetical protein SKA58_04060 [Sphingomonas sp. SKA58]